MAKNRKAGRKASYQNQKYQKESFEGLRESSISAGNKARDGTGSNTFAKIDTSSINVKKGKGTKAYVKKSHDANTIAKTGAVKVGGENSFTSKSNDVVSDFAVKDTVEKGSVINANSRKATGRKLSAKLAKEKANENSVAPLSA